MGPTLDEIYSQLRRALPADHRDVLEVGGATAVPAERIVDEGWLREQIGLGGDRWGIEDRHVLATLWWYSASHFLVTPTAASLVVTGHGVSPALRDLVLHHLPDGRVTGAHSTAVLNGDVAAVGAALRDSLGAAIEAVAAFTTHGDRPLWALATDGLANRMLFFGEAVGRVGPATALAQRLVAAIGTPMPPARYVDVSAAGRGPRRFVRRVSCCLIYRVPGQELCTSCPRRPAADRLRRLAEVARY